MKKTIIAAIAFAAISSTSSAYAGSAGGRIDFYGTVTDTSCTIDIDGQGPDTSVYLAPVSKSELVNEMAVKMTEFNIRVSECPGSKKSASFVLTGGHEAPGGYHYLANLLTPAQGGAKDVYISMVMSTGDKMIGVDYGLAHADFDSNNVANFKMHAGYVTNNKDIVVPGKIHSYAVYQIDYK